jgi:RND family efflux transporter MFP subunit
LWIAGSVIAVLLVALIAVLYPQPPRVTTTIVQRQTLANKIFATGTVKPISRQIVMSQQLTGPIDQVNVQVGQHVRVGDTLLQLNHAAQLASLNAAKATVQQAQAALNQTKAQQVAAPRGYQAQLAGTIANEQSSLAQAEAQLAQAQAAYDATFIKAKLNGTVVIVNPEGIDSNGNPSPVVEVVGPARQLVIEVSEVDAVQIRPGMSADVTADAYPEKHWKATVTQVSDFAVAGASGTGQVEVDLQVKGPFTVPFGFQVNVNIVTETKQQVPVIPYSAVVQDGEQYSAYVVQGGRVKKVDITLGITTDQEVEVTKGLQAGEAVVVNPPTSLKDGEAVSVS